MDSTLLLVLGLLALAGVIVFLAMRQARLGAENASLRADHSAATARLEGAVQSERDRMSEYESLKQDHLAANEALRRLEKDNAELKTEYETLQVRLEKDTEAAEKQIKLLRESEERLTKEFENLANRIFEEKHQKFSQASKESVEGLLKPVREQLKEFKAKVEEVYVAEAKDRTSLHNEIKHLRSLSEQMSVDAVNLTNALKGDSKVRGDWGEVLLERILEESGLRKGIEYETQASLKNEDGQRLQPDVVVHLPEKKDVVIDSKVTLIAYQRYHTAESDEERQAALRDHIAAIRTHISGLSGKSYDELIGLNSLDLVIMFVPIEPAFLLALANEPKLYNEAFSKNILLVSPTTLMITLQIIHNIWRYEYQNQNALVIAQQAGGLHDAFVRFVESLEDIGKHLDKAKDTYETAHKRLLSGKGNIVGRIERLEKLGAKAKKKLPAHLLQSDDDSEADGDGVELGTALPQSPDDADVD